MWDVYFAAGFFNDEQRTVCKNMERLLKQRGFTFFSPRKELLIKPGDPPEKLAQAFTGNLTAIDRSSIVLARIDRWDAGTIWEMGYAYAAKAECGSPSIVAFTTEPRQRLNLMLAQSCDGFLQGWKQIREFLVGRLPGVPSKQLFNWEVAKRVWTAIIE